MTTMLPQFLECENLLLSDLDDQAHVLVDLAGDLDGWSRPYDWELQELAPSPPLMEGTSGRSPQLNRSTGPREC